VTVVEAVPAAHRLLTAVAERSGKGARSAARREAAAAASSLRLFERQFRSTVF
jgi:hypothetical protein